jgi:hypothetical protein
MDDSDEGVSFTKREQPADPAGDAEFDPYRFGKPDHPIPAEYAPPGYTGPTIPSTPPTPYGPPAAGASGNPFANPPGTPYGPPPLGYGAPPPYPYGAPPPPPYHGYPPPPTGNGKAVAGLVLGILSILLCLLSILDGLLIIPGLVFSLIALSESKSRQGSGRGLAIAGLVCTIVGGLLATLVTVAYVRVANKCGDLQDNRDAFQTCVRHEMF